MRDDYRSHGAAQFENSSPSGNRLRRGSLVKVTCRQPAAIVVMVIIALSRIVTSLPK
jgi:hypothetical protein